MDAHAVSHGPDMLGTAMVVLATAVVVVPLAHRLRLSSVLGYLIAGAVIGPHGFGLIAEDATTRVLAEIGVVLMLFLIGLELSFGRLQTMRHHIFGLGLVQVVVTGAVFAVAALALGQPLATAIVIGCGLALSSTAVVLRMLGDGGELIARIGRVSLAVLLFQDIAVAPILALVPLLSNMDGSILLAMAWALTKGVAAVVAIATVGRVLLSPALRFIAKGNAREVFIAAAILVALGTGYATHQIGLSMALGAFLAGLVLAGTEFRHQVEIDIDPFRGLFLGFFFMTVGMAIDPAFILSEAPLIAALVVGILVIKGPIVAVLCVLFKLPRPISLRAGFLLGQGGEFGFVIFGMAMGLGLMSGEVGQKLVTAIALTMALTPFLDMLGRRAAHRLEEREEHGILTLDEDEIADLSDHIVIAGYGRVGRAIARLLADNEVPFVALDLDVVRVRQARERGRPVFYGNAGQPETLDRAGVDRAQAAVVTINQPRQAEQLVRALRQRYPGLVIIARAHDVEHGERLRAAGASQVVLEALELSLHLGHEVMRRIGRKDEDIVRSIERSRHRETTPTGAAPEHPGSERTQDALTL